MIDSWILIINTEYYELIGTKHPQWNSELENQLRSDYDGNFEQDRFYIQYSYNYK